MPEERAKRKIAAILSADAVGYSRLMKDDEEATVSGIAQSAKRLHCTLYCLLFEDNIQGEEVAVFLRHLLRQIPGHLIILLDNAKIHRADPVQALLTRTRRLRTWFPLPPMLRN